MKSDDAGRMFLTFSIDGKERRELARLAKRLGFREPRALAGDLFRIGLETCGARFEPTTRFGRCAVLRESINGPRVESARAHRKGVGRAPNDPDRERRRDRVPRRDGLEA